MRCVSLSQVYTRLALSTFDFCGFFLFYSWSSSVPSLYLLGTYHSFQKSHVTICYLSLAFPSLVHAMARFNQALNSLGSYISVLAIRWHKLDSKETERGTFWLQMT